MGTTIILSIIGFIFVLFGGLYIYERGVNRGIEMWQNYKTIMGEVNIEDLDVKDLEYFRQKLDMQSTPEGKQRVEKQLKLLEDAFIARKMMAKIEDKK